MNCGGCQVAMGIWARELARTWARGVPWLTLRIGTGFRQNQFQDRQGIPPSVNKMLWWFPMAVDSGRIENSSVRGRGSPWESLEINSWAKSDPPRLNKRAARLAMAADDDRLEKCLALSVLILSSLIIAQLIIHANDTLAYHMSAHHKLAHDS